VDFGDVTPGNIPNVGNVTNAVDFNFTFNNCRGYSQVRYYFYQLPTPYYDTSGILPMENTGSGYASGVAIQLHRRNTPSGSWSLLTFGDFYNLSSHNYVQNCTSGCNYTVPMQARVIRQSASTNPGTIYARMQMHMQYN